MIKFVVEEDGQLFLVTNEITRNGRVIRKPYGCWKFPYKPKSK
jgi:hypothetical protein